MVQVEPSKSGKVQHRQQLLRRMLKACGLEARELKPALVLEWFGDRALKLWPLDASGESRKLYRDLFALRGYVQTRADCEARLKRAADVVPEVGIKRAQRQFHVDDQLLRDEMRRRGFVYVNRGRRVEFSGWFSREHAKARRAA